MLKWYLFGEVRQTNAITVDDIKLVMSEAQKHAEAIRNAPTAYVLDILSRAGKILSDQSSDRYTQIVETMNKQLGWSKEMVIEGLKTISDILTYKHLETRLKADIGEIRCLDEFAYNKAFKGMVKAEPFGVISHVSAGNVFVGAVDTLVQGLITKNVNILKMSSADPIFPMIFAEVIKDVDYMNILSQSFALVPFKGGDKDVESIVKAQSDVLVVYGGEETVKAYREGAGFHTKIIEYGPKYSLAIISKESLNSDNIQSVARSMARDFTMWEQSACSSPHAVFIDSYDLAYKFAQTLKEEMAYWAKTIPHSKIPTNEAVEILRTREVTRVDEALGEAELIIPATDNQEWTIIFQKECKFKVSPHHRTAYVIVSENHETDTISALKEYGKFIQSIALMCPTPQKLKLGDKLVNMGADRIVEIGMMARRKHGTPHDGTRGTSEMLRWVSMGSDAPFENPFDYLPDEERDKITLMRLNAFLNYIRQTSPYYNEILPNKDLATLSELATLPVLSPQILRSKLPPRGEGILTEPLGASISFGSGGTTGDPKFIHRTNEENHHNAQLIGKGYALSIFDSSDIVANLLFAGNMWASFLSHNEAVEATGAHVLPIAGNISMDDIISTLRAFKPTGAISIPSVILSLAEYVDKNNITDLKIKKIVTGGEHLYPEAKEYISKVLGTQKFASTGYLSNDTGSIGFQCELIGDALHHIHEDYCIMEVVDPETNQPLPDGETGKILVTNFSRTLMPLVRYDIGDMGRILTQKCQCGRQLRLMELKGRSDDTLIIGGGNIQLEAIAQVIAKLPELSYHFRIMANVKERKDQFTLEVESIKVLTDAEYATLSEKLYNQLLLDKHEFLAFMKTGSIQPPIVKVLPPDSLPRNPRTGKIKQVIDNRN